LRRRHKPVQPRQGCLPARGFLLSFHRPKLQLNILNIFSRTRRISLLKPDNEKKPTTKIFSKILKKPQIFLTKKACFERFYLFPQISCNNQQLRTSNIKRASSNSIYGRKKERPDRVDE
jgi:hypothetical protein